MRVHTQMCACLLVCVSVCVCCVLPFACGPGKRNSCSFLQFSTQQVCTLCLVSRSLLSKTLLFMRLPTHTYEKFGFKFQLVCFGKDITYLYLTLTLIYIPAKAHEKKLMRLAAKMNSSYSQQNIKFEMQVTNKVKLCILF